MRVHRLLLILGLLTMLAATGCIFSPKDDDPGDTPPPVDPYRAYTSPDNVYLNYQDIYANLDIDEYRDALDPDFQFIETDLDVYNFDSEITIMDNIFAGRPGVDENQNPEAPISSISFQLTPAGAWQNIPADDQFFGGATGQWRDFTLLAAFERQADTRLEVSGQVRMYVKQITVDSQIEFRVLGFRDNTSAKIYF